MRYNVRNGELRLTLDEHEASVLDDIVEFYSENNGEITANSQEANFILTIREGLDKMLGTGEES